MYQGGGEAAHGVLAVGAFDEVAERLRVGLEVPHEKALPVFDAVANVWRCYVRAVGRNQPVHAPILTRQRPPTRTRRCTLAYTIAY